MGQNIRELLASYSDALYPIIYIHGAGVENSAQILTDIAENQKVVEFQRCLGNEECTLKNFLTQIMNEEQEKETWIVLGDIHSQMEAPEIVSLLKGIAKKQLYDDNYHVTIWIISDQLCIPQELEKWITIVHIPRPDISGVRNIIAGFVRDFDMGVSEDVVSRFAVSLKGLNEFQIKQILHLAYQNGGNLESSDIALIRRQKELLAERTGLLEVIKADNTLEDIGGLENLKEWLYRKECIFKNLLKAQKNGVAVPRGMAIAGMPGCGKSLGARAAADIFGLPLVRANMEKALSERGEKSESGMEKALELLEIMSPCVLWLDEMERFCSGESGNLFGRFLTRIQRKDMPVFLAATVNDMTRIPPEFLRKKYFDQWFFVDFPNEEERRRIMEICLRAQGRWHPGLDIQSLAKAAEGYSGKELETVVQEAVEDCFIFGRDTLTTKDLHDALARVIPVSKAWEDEIKQTRERIDRLGLKAAGSKDNKAAVRLWKPDTGIHKSGICVSPEAVTLYEVLGRDWWKKPGARGVDKSAPDESDAENGSGGLSGYGIGLI